MLLLQISYIYVCESKIYNALICFLDLYYLVLFDIICGSESKLHLNCSTNNDIKVDVNQVFIYSTLLTFSIVYLYVSLFRFCCVFWEVFVLQLLNFFFFLGFNRLWNNGFLLFATSTSFCVIYALPVYLLYNFLDMFRGTYRTFIVWPMVFQMSHSILLTFLHYM